jgi:hypothetical protein
MKNGSTPPGLDEWLKNVVGSYRVLDTVQDHARSTVYKIESGEQTLVLKCLKTADRWHREVYAYRNWASSLSAYVPKLLSASADYQCVLLTCLNGVPMKHKQFEHVLIVEAYRAAGLLARKFRGAGEGRCFGDVDATGHPFGNVFTHPVQFFMATFGPACHRVLNEIAPDSDTCRILRWAERNVDAFADQKAVPVNPDFDTGNWLANERDGFVGIIDFEYARWGLEYETFIPIWTREYARMCDEAEETFFSAYGYASDHNASRRKSLGLIKEALLGVVWSLENEGKALTYHIDKLKKFGTQI